MACNHFEQLGCYDSDGCYIQLLMGIHIQESAQNIFCCFEGWKTTKGKLMNITIMILRLIALFFSLFGYAQLLKTKTEIETDFLPVFITTGITCVLFIAGLCNVLQAGAIMLFVVGCLLGILYIIKKLPVKPLFSFGTVFFLLMTIALLIILGNDTRLFLGDNFTHWAVVARVIFRENRFPTGADALIEYSTYPIGTATWIYYVVKILGADIDSVYCLGQDILIIASISALFAFSKEYENKYYKYATAIVTVLVCLMLPVCNRDGLINLTVDTAQSCLAISCFAIIYYYSGKQRTAEICWITALPVIILLGVTKFSCLFFVFFAALFYALFHDKENERRSVFTSGVSLGISSILVFGWFYLKAKNSFSRFENSAQAASLERWTKLFSEKTPEFRNRVLCNIVDNLVSRTNTFLFCAFWIILIICFIIVCKRKNLMKTEHYVKYIVLICIMYAAYCGFLYLTYIFSMTPKEAEKLASFTRYHKVAVTVCSACLFMMSLSMIRKFADTGNHPLIIILLFAGVVCLSYCSLRPVYTDYIPQRNNKAAYGEYLEMRESLDSVIKEYGIESGKSYLIVDDRDPSYYTLCSRYCLYSSEIDETDSESRIKAPDNVGSYDYIIVFDADKENKEILRNMYENTSIKCCFAE